MHDLDIADLIDFARRWADLGEAVADQVARVLEDPGSGSCWQESTEHGVNPAAIRLAQNRLRGMHEGIDEVLADFLDAAESAQ